MDMQSGSVRSSHRAAPQAPFPIILPAEAIAVTLLIIMLALGVMIRSST